MRRSKRILAGVSSVVLASTIAISIVPSAVSAASAPNLGFCEPLVRAAAKITFVKNIYGFSDLPTGEDSPSLETEDEFSALQMMGMVLLLFSPSLAIDYKEAHANLESGKLKSFMNTQAKFYSTGALLLKKNGFTTRDINGLHTIDLSKLEFETAADTLTPEHWSDAKVNALSAAAQKWSRTSRNISKKHAEDKSLKVSLNKALEDCDPVDNRGARVQDACKLLTSKVLEDTIEAERADLGSDQIDLLRRRCSGIGAGGTLILVVTTQRQLSPTMESLKDATNVNNFGKTARITDGVSIASLNSFLSERGKTLWVTAEKTAFVLSVDKIDSQTSAPIEITDEELISAGKAIAKALKI